MADTDLEDEIDRSTRLIRALVCVVLLTLTVGAAGYLRVVGLNWDENQHLHPDERFLTMVTSALAPVRSVGEYFDTINSTLNPNNVGFGFYVYGDFPVILARYIGQLIGQTDYFNVYLVGRVLSACADLGVLLLIFFIAVELFDWRVGLLASALYGAAALPIQLAHFYTVDTFTNFFVAASFLFIARAARQHRWRDFVLFGIAFGVAVAGKISVFPLAVVFALVVVIRVTSEQQLAVSRYLERVELSNLLWSNISLRRAWIGLALAGLISIIAFRVSQPYAFLPPDSGVPIDSQKVGALAGVVSKIGEPLGLRPNPLWLNQMNEVRLQVSGYSDIPPNHQWAKRLPLVFPWINMVRVGLGWPLGVFCWLAFAWAIWELVRGHRGSLMLLPVVTWTGLFFVWQGTGWVMTMRYFLPVYPFLVLLAAWALVTAWDRIQVLLATRHQPRWHWSSGTVAAIGVIVIGGGYAWGFAVSRIYTRPVTRVAASRWILENIPSDVTLAFSTEDGPHQYQLGLFNNYPPTPLNGADADPARPLVSHTRLTGSDLQAYGFTSPFTGTLTGIRLNRVLEEGPPDLRTIQVGLAADPLGKSQLIQEQISDDFSTESYPQGHAETIRIPPTKVTEGTTYYFTLRLDPGPPLDLFSATVATEGEWDDPLPLSLAPYDVWGAEYQGYEMQLVWEDIPVKRDRMQFILDQTDYLLISSNRFYASLPRNPERFPMTIAYYKALFSGDLGFDLVADFTSRPNLGPIQFYDDNAEEAWTVYDHPRVMIFKKTDRYSSAHTAMILDSVDLNTVVKAIAKDAKGTPVTLALPTLSAAASPGQTVSSNPTAAVALADFYRANQWISVVVWWLLMTLIGWITFPILFSLVPGLPDRGYPFSRIVGLILSAWGAWFAASVHVLPWAEWAIVIVLVLMASVSIVIAFARRGELVRWLIVERRYILLVESLMLLLFVYFLLVRLGNPDLWHPSFGGEKPMDMAYFNAVLKSAAFPPYDPWFAGGTINYYYFGFVIVGLPVKLLGLPATLAYNLILPTLFAMTGIGAFSVVFNLVSLRSGPADDSRPMAQSESDLMTVLKAWPRVSPSELRIAVRQLVSGPDRPTGWLPFAAGLAAILLTAVLGNLDQIRTLVWGLAELGSGLPQWANTPLPDPGNVLHGLRLLIAQGQVLPVGLGEWYWNATRLIPVPIVDNMPTEIGPITEFPYFTFLYADLHAHMIALPITLLALAWCVANLGSVIRKVSDAKSSSTRSLILNIAFGGLIIGSLRPTNTWDWPTYTGLAGIALVITHFYRRNDVSALPALATGGIGSAICGGLVYLFFASTPASGASVSSIELIAASIGAVIGLLIGFGVGMALFAARLDPTGAEADPLRPWLTLLSGLLQIGFLAGFSLLAFLPFVLNYKLAYASFVPWTGSRTPLWAYLDILGLFLFIIVSWMVSETLDWVGQLRRMGKINRRQLVPGLIVGAAIIGMILLAISRNFVSAGFVLPMMLWAIVLFMRQDLPIEKRAILAILTVALGLSQVVEVVVLQGDLSRMNTVFKFYIQVWVLMAITASAALGWLWPAIARLKSTPRTVWLAGLGTLVFLAALYPLLATRAKIADRWAPDAPHTLDGMAYMPYAERYENGVSFSLKPDYDALRWLQDNIQGTPVVLEAHTLEYNWGNRVTVYTGLPAIVGWNWHQRQQRPEQSDEVWARVALIDLLYNTTDTTQTMELLHQYNVKLVIVGDLERAYYSALGLAKFKLLADDGLLTKLYDQGNTAIYAVGGNP